MSKQKHLIFVYGTLKKGFGNNRLLSASKLVAKATTADAFVLMDFGGFPGLFLSGKGMEPTQVRGEVWEVDDATLASCDRLEGHPHWYKRTPLRLVAEDGKPIKAEVYLLSGDANRGTQCMDGEWPSRVAKYQDAAFATR